jgi:hypothetical protein
MEDSPHYASALHTSEDLFPEYQWRVPALPSKVFAERGAHTQAIFQFDDIPSDSPESTPSSASSHRGRSRWSTQARFAHDYHDTAHHLAADYDCSHPSTPLDPPHTTSYSQMILFPEQPQALPTYEHAIKEQTHGPSVPSRPIRFSHQSTSAQQPSQHTRAYVSYERSHVSHLDWREVEMSAAIRMQDTGQPTSWYCPEEQPLGDTNNTYFVPRGMPPTEYSGHTKHPVIGRCEHCGYRDHWSLVELHRRNCIDSQYK